MRALAVGENVYDIVEEDETGNGEGEWGGVERLCLECVSLQPVVPVFPMLTPA
jgi:hypothetical protein